MRGRVCAADVKRQSRQRRRRFVRRHCMPPEPTHARACARPVTISPKHWCMSCMSVVELFFTKTMERAEGVRVTVPATHA